MTDALALRPSGYLAPPSEDEFRGMIYMAKQLAEVQGFVPAHFYRQPNKVLAAMLYGRDLGITPTNALQHIIVIDGKATADAQLMGMLVRRAGHRLEDKTTAESSTVTITRGDDGSVHTFTFSVQDARRAGLVRSGSAWEKYPQAMLYARALTGCARKGAQDALMGVAYTPEELGAEVQVVDGEAVVLAAPGVSEAPAPSEGAPAAEVPQEAQPPAAEVPQAPPSAPVAPLAGASVSRRMGAGRSISPVRKNTVTVTPAAQEPTTPATAPEAAPAPAPQAVAVPSQPAPSALTDEPDLPAPVDEGQRVYLESLRGDLRSRTALLFRVNAIINNVKRSLEGQEPDPLPSKDPSADSDAALARRIEQDWPGRTLANLGQAELEGLLERFDANLAKKREVMKERGIPEE